MICTFLNCNALELSLNAMTCYNRNNHDNHRILKVHAENRSWKSVWGTGLQWLLTMVGYGWIGTEQTVTMAAVAATPATSFRAVQAPRRTVSESLVCCSAGLQHRILC